MGHRGQDATENVIRENFLWKGLAADVRSFVQGCLHCICTRTGEVVPRPFGHGLHATKPNEELRLDFLFLGPSTSRMSYVIVMRDDLPSYIWLYPTHSATSEGAADALGMWTSVFGSVEWVVSDQGAHFKNELMQALTEELRATQQFTTAYSPWANGSVERVCREILRACSAVLQEFRPSQRDWSAVTECVQSVINHAPLKQLRL